MRIVICPPGPVPGARSKLNRFGVSRPDNRPAAPPPTKPRSRTPRRPAPIEMDKLYVKARDAMAKRIAERALKEQPAESTEGLRLTSCSIPVRDVTERAAKL